MNDQQLLDKIHTLGARAAITAILLELERAETKFPAWPSDLIHAAAIAILPPVQHEFVYSTFPFCVKSFQNKTPSFAEKQ